MDKESEAKVIFHGSSDDYLEFRKILEDEAIELVAVHPMDDMAERERRERILQMQNSGIAISSVGMLFGVLFTLLTIWFFRGL